MRLCLIGTPVEHSLSPLIHNTALSLYGLSGAYELLNVPAESLEKTVLSLAQNNFNGANITVPHKEAVFRLIKNRSPEAELVGAVNSLRLDSSGIISAHNTDLGGFIEACKQNIIATRGSNISAAVIGSGGSARACLYGLSLLGFANVDLIARNKKSATAIYSDFQEQKLKLKALSESACTSNVQILDSEKLTAHAKKGQWSVIVNCTPVGLGNAEIPLSFLELLSSKKTWHSNCLFFDTVYSKDKPLSPLSEKALVGGFKAIDGRIMLIEQARLAFEYWTGKRPAAELLIKCMEK